MRVRLRLITQRPSHCLLVQAQRDPAAFATFYDTYSDRVLAFLVRRVLDPEIAFDLLSETFAKALERRQQFRGSSAGEEQGWLFSIARTELSHYWRSGRVERETLRRYALEVPPLAAAEHDRIEGLAGLGELSEALTTALSALPREQQDAIRLRVIEELSYPELASVLGISEATARARVSRGLRALAHTVPRHEAVA